MTCLVSNACLFYFIMLMVIEIILFPVSLVFAFFLNFKRTLGVYKILFNNLIFKTPCCSLQDLLAVGHYSCVLELCVRDFVQFGTLHT